MIALDSSAIVAAALKEPDFARFLEVLSNNSCLIGYPTLFETSLVLINRIGAENARAFLHGFIRDPQIVSIPFDAQLLSAAQAAYEKFGRGRHPAQLNFGDCMAYAVAKVHNAPLLYKGDDFSRTDIRSALP